MRKIVFTPGFVKTVKIYNPILNSFLSGLFLLGACAFSVTAFSQEDSKEIVSNSQLEAPGKRSTSIEGYLRFEGMKYPSSIPGNSALDQSLLASVQMRTQSHFENFQLGFDWAAGQYVDLGGSQYSVHELYATGFANKHRTQYSLGRKIEFWSQLDHDWQLGLWQPKSLFDSLRPEDSGLTGVFFKHQETDTEFLAFVSPIFVPTMGPEVKQKNGTLIADSRWYRSPSGTFPLFGKQTKIVYSLDTPNLAKLVNNPGLGVRAKMGRESGGLWVSANGGYKPMNSLLLKYKKNLYLPEQDPQTGEVSISPDVGYHYLWGADIGYRFSEALITSFSYLEDRPVSKTPETSYVIQTPKPMRAFSFQVANTLDVSFFTEPVAISGNYLRILGGEIVDYDENGTPQGAIFDQRFNFTNAASIQMDFSSRFFGKKMMSSFKYMREFDQSGMLINGEINFYPVNSLALIMGVDVLGVDGSEEKDTNTRFLNQFRANDRVYGGMSYVF